MIVTPYKTHKIQPNEDLFDILDKYLPPLKEKSVVAVTSKIVGMCEGRVIKKISEEQKNELAKKEAFKYLPREMSRYNFMITITKNILIASAGIDQSNSHGYYSLWPKDPQKSVNAIREYLVQKHKIQHLGVILTDSKLMPLRWGLTGVGLSHSGFLALNNYIGKPDIDGEAMRVTQASIVDSLSTAAVAVMGEGAEQQPLAVIKDVPFVQFQDRNPTQEELDALRIDTEDDVYSPLLTAVDWKKGDGEF
jgi:dihydrofolate synthase / folylpolyglutamate synthase